MAYLRRVFADAGGENDCVDTAEDCDERSDLPGGAVDEVIDGELRGRLAAGDEITHVVADSGDAEQTGFLVENRLHFLDRQTEALEQIQHDAGIERAWARAHAQSVERGEPERG